MAVNQILADRVRAAAVDEAASRHLELREKHMFGGLAFMLADKMACGVVGEKLMVRVGPDAYDEALARAHVRPMDFTGRPMRGYVFVEPAGCTRQSQIDRWVKQAALHVEALTSAGITPTGSATTKGERA